MALRDMEGKAVRQGKAVFDLLPSLPLSSPHNHLSPSTILSHSNPPCFRTMTTLPNAQGTIIGPNANFQTVAGDSTTNIYSNSSSEVTLVSIRQAILSHNFIGYLQYGRTVRRIIDGDIIFQRVLSSKVLSINVKQDGGASTDSQVIKVKKMEQSAELYGYQGRFTATSFEPVAEKDWEKFKEVSIGVWFE
ncbi:hypothetical protein PQX77_015518 [Marasmius sp. AFHP31]|nr:hypothetical protein PQX77_015518 [Marasmius sp. AFHP31]